jgi:nucleotide-binding universal stress UspA family protein
VYVESRDQAVERHEHELGEELDVLARPLRALGCAVRTVIRFGEPAAEVLEVARAGEFDLVVVAGTPHAAGRALRPGIASRLMRSGLAPVLLVPQHRSARKERRRAG